MVVRLTLALVVVLAVLAVAAELAVPSLVESGVEDTVRERSDGATAVRAEVGDAPHLPGLLREGRLDRLTVTLEEVAGRQVRLDTVSLALDGIEIDRGAALRGEVEITGVERGTALIEVEQQRIADALGVPVDLVDRALRAAVAAGSGVELPGVAALLPCAPEVEIADGLARLTCVFDEVPEILLPAGTD